MSQKVLILRSECLGQPPRTGTATALLHLAPHFDRVFVEADSDSWLLGLIDSEALLKHVVPFCAETEVLKHLARTQGLDEKRSFVVGPAFSDLALVQLEADQSWTHLQRELLTQHRRASTTRNTLETRISIDLHLDHQGSDIETGIPFYDHMLEQIAKHGGFYLNVRATGDIEVEAHHLVEDVALALGETYRKALGTKHGIARFGFALPMDETIASVHIDLSGRPFSRFEGDFTVERLGDLPTEMVPHFFRSFADALQCTLHVEVVGENNHHMVESCFKALGRALRKASAIESNELPSTKGAL